MSVVDPHFNSPFHTLSLQRIPLRRRETLQAWDAADEYLLNHFFTEFARQKSAPDQNVLVCNDNFGALCLNLHDYKPALYTDSHIAELALTHNAQLNNLPVSSVSVIPSTAEPAGSSGNGKWDVVLMKLPKNQSWFREQLIQIKPFLNEGSKVIVAAMVKHLPHSALEQLEQIIGPASLSRAKKKARLLMADTDLQRKALVSKYPRHWQVDNARKPHNGIKLINHANTFSRDSLDIGARFFIEHLPTGIEGDIIDMGCGNGIIGIATAMQNPGHITFVDESHMAVASAQASWLANDMNEAQASFKVNDALQGFAANSADCVLCNPPFHQQTTVGDQIAQRMFRDAKQVLKPGGEFRVIGNRHLGYHGLMKKLFGNCTLVASNSKFVVLSSIR
ncbi:methyltransferase [Endozoicomonas lisbonensis]|uniref:Ribosomal RNA large subunit methyltransferase G n=1 Tax=Endozoicomonas lisbonensis TaxID=3120522 RepID=A0ABV2SKM6_9GAMM